MKSEKITLGDDVSILAITSFCDSDWGGCISIRYSRDGCMVFHGNGPVVWY